LEVRRAYPSDLTDEEWHQIMHLVPCEKPFGRKRTVDVREIVNAIFYVSATKCAWRYLPHDLPPWGTVYSYYVRWQANGTLPKLTGQINRSNRSPHNGTK
jgi:transposase